MTTVARNADHIGRGMRVVPPGKKRLVTVIDHFTYGPSIDVYYETSQGHGVFIISRYDDIQIEVPNRG